ncbi:MAG: plastocyanin/azurin family copper-binding protein [Solirubrobacterales bacterium]
MSAYFVMGIITVAWAMVLAAIGLTRENFPSSGAGLRAIIAVTVLLVAGTLVALFATTKKEHPLREAAEKEAEAAQEHEGASGGGGEQAPAEKPPAKGGGTIEASETEYSIKLADGDTVDPGEYEIEVANDGKIDHDLAIEGEGTKGTKTPLIAPGEGGKLTVDLEPGQYRLYCTVPGHEEAGMELDLTVR